MKPVRLLPFGLAKLPFFSKRNNTRFLLINLNLNKNLALNFRRASASRVAEPFPASVNGYGQIQMTIVCRYRYAAGLPPRW